MAVYFLPSQKIYRWLFGNGVSFPGVGLHCDHQPSRPASLPTSQGYSWHRLPDPSWANITGRFRAALLPVEATFWKMDDGMKMGCVRKSCFFHGKKHMRNIYNKPNSSFGRGFFVCLCLDPFVSCQPMKLWYLAELWGRFIWLLKGGIGLIRQRRVNPSQKSGCYFACYVYCFQDVR